MLVTRYLDAVLRVKLAKMNWNNLILCYLCLMFNILTSQLCDCKQRVCKEVMNDSGSGTLEENVLDLCSDDCPLSASVFRIYRVLSTNETDISSK